MNIRLNEALNTAKEKIADLIRDHDDELNKAWNLCGEDKLHIAIAIDLEPDATSIEGKVGLKFAVESCKTEAKFTARGQLPLPLGSVREDEP